MKKTFFVCVCAMALAACSGVASPSPAPSSKADNTPTPASAPKPTDMPTDMPIITRATPKAVTMIEWGLAALAPTEKDKTLLDGPVYIQTKKITVVNGAFALELTGTLPTPCNMLRVTMDKPTADKRVNLKVYSVSDPTRMCADVIAPLNVRVNLGALPAGTYSFSLNGEDMGKATL